MKLFSFAIFLSMALLVQLLPYPFLRSLAVAAGSQDAAGYSAGARQRPYSARPAGLSASGASEKERQLAEREAALNLKEQELKRLSARLDARMRELDSAKKSMETTLSTRKKADGDRYKKLLKVYKALRPEEAAGLIDKLDEDMTMELLNQMDAKTAAKLIPYLDKKKVLKWSRASLKGN